MQEHFRIEVVVVVVGGILIAGCVSSSEYQFDSCGDGFNDSKEEAIVTLTDRSESSCGILR